MKKSIVILFIALSLFSCKKEEDNIATVTIWFTEKTSRDMETLYLDFVDVYVEGEFVGKLYRNQYANDITNCNEENTVIVDINLGTKLSKSIRFTGKGDGDENWFRDRQEIIGPGCNLFKIWIC